MKVRLRTDDRRAVNPVPDVDFLRGKVMVMDEDEESLQAGHSSDASLWAGRCFQSFNHIKRSPKRPSPEAIEAGLAAFRDH